MATKTQKRVLVSLPEKTVKFADPVWRKKKFPSRNAFVDEATRYYATLMRRKELKDELIRGYQATAQENLALAKEWEVVDAPLPNDAIEKDYNR